MPSLFRIIAAAALALLAIAPRNAAGSSFGAQIGWLEGGCLAVPNAAIAPGASATFLLFDPERAEGDVPSALLVPGAILRKAAPSTSCAAPPVEVNGAEPDWTLYEVEIEKVHTPSRAKGLGLLAVGRHIDLDGNGETESFGICRTENGVRLDIWSDGLGRGDRLWSALLRSPSKSGSSSCDPAELFYAPLGRFEAQVGYVHQCLAIKDPTLAPGTRVTIIAPQNGRYEIGQRLLTRRIQGAVRAKVDSDERCPPLHEAPRSENEAEGVSFYEIALEPGRLITESEAIFGIAMVGLGWPAEKRIDLDSNGEDDSFTACKSLEGLNFELWSGAPEKGEPLWHAYYYLFYDSAEWDCPGMFEDDLSNSTSEPP
jgi:hypothetical protein